MNTYKIFFLFACIVLLQVRCADELKIEPQTDVTEEVALDNEEAVQSLLVGAYDLLGDDDVYGGWIQMTSDLLGTNNDINWGGTFTDPDDLWLKVTTSANGQVEVTWTETYEVINVANTILANLGVVADDERARIEGEAKFIRGMLYFELIRLFGKDWTDGDPTTNLGVPLKLTPTNLVYAPEENFIGRSTVAQVYAQAISDLTAAEELLPEENGFFATTWAAKAVLARVYLQQQNYKEASLKASEVIESGNYALVDRVDRAFNQAFNSSEDVFSIQITNQDGENAFQTFYASRDFNGRRDIRVRGNYVNLFEQNDDRLKLLLYEDGTSGRILSGKYKDQFANVSVIRLAEMYLIRAEGNLMSGEQTGPNTPSEDLQVIRSRAHASDAPANPTITDIYLERKRELGFEGHFLHDVHRSKTNITQNANNTENGYFEWNHNMLVLPIPQREVDANPSLQGQQNPGYGI
ncbi:RagB/SusD family nutrient uptake outer membrane protein [Chryseosolibacter indicus]|uniref:RagB/SusD family nutrient uptake outer membrane protein n=1 Tax=Chryseosolibacter indicus TaxID=2782351 RepID=A0ABS5VVH2_9BACT|nr:RagB/SusD family nutrient uptake outer membrane protein [Chryseosolibacter indicus]MBT1705221.1 RagB/SusD family nutrient uptake outer membrane protein [Chryseosolibacter indicus]